MTSKLSEVAVQALSLSSDERALLAQKLWESLDESDQQPSAQDDEQAIADAKRRDSELTTRAVEGRSHEEVMEAARKSIQCE